MCLVSIACILQALYNRFQEIKAELWGVGYQSPPDAWFSHSNFGHLSKKCPSSQTGWPIFIRLVAFACIFEALYDTCQKIKNRSRKSWVMVVGCQSQPDAWFSLSNFGHLSKKCPGSQNGQLIFIRLVAFACIFEALYDTCQKIKNRSRKSRVMGWKRTAFFMRRLKKSDFPIPILTSCVWSVIAPKQINQFWRVW